MAGVLSITIKDLVDFTNKALLDGANLDTEVSINSSELRMYVPEEDFREAPVVDTLDDEVIRELVCVGRTQLTGFEADVEEITYDKKSNTIMVMLSTFII